MVIQFMKSLFNNTKSGGVNMGQISLVINDRNIVAAEGKTILQVCKENDIFVPTFCNHPKLKPLERCGCCVVELAEHHEPVKACGTVIKNGMKISTESTKAVSARIAAINKMLGNHPNDCLTCAKTGGNCLLQEVSHLYDVDTELRVIKNRGLDDSSPAMIRDLDKCVDCGRCVEVCETIQRIGCYEHVYPEDDHYVTTKGGFKLSETDCINCGQCVKVCPVAALQEKDAVHDVLAALADPSKKVIFQMAPAIHNTAGEEFGLPEGADVTRMLATGLRKMGATVFTTDYTADVTILEEGTEFLNRVTKGGVLPMFTSCCPGWIKFIEYNYPKLFPHLSTCKSPQQKFGALLKTYYAEKQGIDPKDIYHVSIMPCVAKKFESQRPEMNSSGHRDVDAVITTRELAKLFNFNNINLAEQKGTDFDKMMGEGTGAARIFAVSGGVMEAALRTAVMKLTNNEINTIDYVAVRDTPEGDVKEAELDVKGTKVRVAVVNGIGNARKVLDDVVAKKSPYHFIEFMACPGGCVGGGGSPVKGKVEPRTAGIYDSDVKNPVRRSHENKEVQELYRDYLGEPCGHKSHDLLHTHYHDRSGEVKYPKSK